VKVNSFDRDITSNLYTYDFKIDENLDTFFPFDHFRNE
jgi:hypothetical protein